MKKVIVCLIFLISFANAIQCYNGKTYVDIPESKLSDLGYTKYNITHSSFDCKMAYKRYLKVKEIEPVNVSYVIKDEKNEIKEPSKIGSLYICLLVIIVGVIWLIKNVIKDEPQDEWYSASQKEQVKPTGTVSIQKVPEEYYRNWNDLKKLEDERQKKRKAYFDAILGKNYSVSPDNNVKPEEQVKQKNDDIKKEPVKSSDDSFDDYWNNLLGLSDDDSENLRNPVKPIQKFNKTYDELLTRQEWYDFRKKVIYDRGGYVCEYCKKKHNLQIHHKLYYKKPDKEKIEPWLYNMDEVLLLCDNCHKSIHKKNKIKVYYISYADYNNRKVVFYNEFNQNL